MNFYLYDFEDQRERHFSFAGKQKVAEIINGFIFYTHKSKDQQRWFSRPAHGFLGLGKKSFIL
jgi:hypothetical protein